MPQFKCTLCPKSCRTRKSLNDHVATHSLDVSNADAQSKTPKIEIANNTEVATIEEAINFGQVPYGITPSWVSINHPKSKETTHEAPINSHFQNMPISFQTENITWNSSTTPQISNGPQINHSPESLMAAELASSSVAPPLNPPVINKAALASCYMSPHKRKRMEDPHTFNLETDSHHENSVPLSKSKEKVTDSDAGQKMPTSAFTTQNTDGKGLGTSAVSMPTLPIQPTNIEHTINERIKTFQNEWRDQFKEYLKVIQRAMESTESKAEQAMGQLESLEILEGKIVESSKKQQTLSTKVENLDGLFKKALLEANAPKFQIKVSLEKVEYGERHGSPDSVLGFISLNRKEKLHQ